MDLWLPGSTVHKISQARILDWVAISSSRISSQLPGGSDGKVSVYDVRDLGSIPGSGRSTREGEGNGNPLQYYCLENPMDRGAWSATVHGVSKSRTQLSDFTFLSFPFLYFPPGYLPNSGIEPWSLALAGGFFTTESPGKPFTNDLSTSSIFVTLALTVLEYGLS